jgi:hypothetical protein
MNFDSLTSYENLNLLKYAKGFEMKKTHQNLRLVDRDQIRCIYRISLHTLISPQIFKVENFGEIFGIRGMQLQVQLYRNLPFKYIYLQLSTIIVTIKK